MLFDGALDHLAGVKLAIESDDNALRDKNLNAVSAIIDGLQSSLDAQQGGELAENLYALYSYMHRRLTDCASENSVGIVIEVGDLMHTLKEAWAAIDPRCQEIRPPILA